jgi:hypothetical protein
MALSGLAMANVGGTIYINAKMTESKSSGQAHAARQPEFIYPEGIWQNRIEGCVVVSFDIGADGLADHYKLIDAVPRGVGFERKAMYGLNRAVFQMPAKPGRYATRVDFRVMKSEGSDEEDQDAVQPSRDCKPVPSYDELNPTTAASKSETK